MRNYITQEIFDAEAGHCDYWDWHFEAINFQWLPKRGVWHIGYYDYSGIFNGKIEGRELTRCVCNDGQFTHFKVVDKVRVPLLCPTCEPEPTPPPPPTMCLVEDTWNQRQSVDGSGWFIHDMNCEEVRFNRNGLEIYDKNTPATKEGLAEIGWNLLGDIMYERDDNYDIPEGVEPKQGEWKQYFNLKKAKATAAWEVAHYFQGCPHGCMTKHKIVEEANL